MTCTPTLSPTHGRADGCVRPMAHAAPHQPPASSRSRALQRARLSGKTIGPRANAARHCSQPLQHPFESP